MIRRTRSPARNDPSRGIICGAHNFVVGDLIVACLPGAVLPGDFQIAARKTYGHKSDGMICSAKELGLGEDHDGIIVLKDLGLTGEPGDDAIALLGLDQVTLDVNVTPDRGYQLSMRGIAREYAQMKGQSFTDIGSAEVERCHRRRFPCVDRGLQPHRRGAAATSSPPFRSPGSTRRRGPRSGCSVACSRRACARSA